MAPVLRRWIDSSGVDSAAGAGSARRCRRPARPPAGRARPPRPDRHNRRRPPRAVGRRLASTSKARVSRASPARMAMASPNFLWQVGLPAAQIVVVHRRQVVVDQRIGVDHLHRAGRRHRRLGGAPTGLGRHQHQHRPQPLARGQQAVANRLPKLLGTTVPQGTVGPQGRIDTGAELVGVFRERGSRRIQG